MPSTEQKGSRVISLRLSDSLLDRLERYRDWMEIHHHEKISRNQAIRLSLTQWLEDQESQGSMAHPDVLRQRFHDAYTSLKSGQGPVHIHRLRQLLNWTTDRFDAVLEQLRAGSQVVIHVGEADGLSTETRRDSYEVNGQLYFTLSWQN